METDCTSCSEWHVDAGADVDVLSGRDGVVCACLGDDGLYCSSILFGRKFHAIDRHGVWLRNSCGTPVGIR